MKLKQSNLKYYSVLYSMINLIDTSDLFKYNLTKMLKTRLRIDGYLKILVNIMSVSEAKYKKMIGEKMINFNAQLMNSLIQNQTNIIKILKLIILIQRCIIEQNTMGYGRILQKLIKKCEDHEKLSNLVCNELDTQTVEYFIKNLLSPLLFYLQRRLQVLENKKQSERQPSIIKQKNIENMKNKQNNFKPKYVSQIKANQQEKQHCGMANQVQKIVQGCYLIVNLLNRFSVIARPLQTIIRYYGGCYGCFQDLNISLAMDIQKLYQQLSQKIQKITGLINFNINVQSQLNAKENKTVSSEQENLRIFQELEQLLKQIQKVKETMYFIFYNSYYSSSLKPYIPNFINISVMQEKLQGMKKTLMESKIACKNEIFQKKLLNKYQRSKLVRSGGTNLRKNIDMLRLSVRNSNNNEKIKNQQSYSLNKQNVLYGLNQISLMKDKQNDDQEFERTMHSSTFSIRMNEIEYENLYKSQEIGKYNQNFSDLEILQSVMKSIQMIESQRNNKQNNLFSGENKPVNF